MSFCRKCGTELPEDASFCIQCGTQVAYSVPCQQPQPESQQIQQTPMIPPKTRKSGRGFAISSMILGAVGVMYGFLMVISFTPRVDATSALWSVAILSGLPILALIFSFVARVRGWKNGFSRAGMITGIIGVSLYVLIVIAVSAHGFFANSGNPIDYFI